MAWLIFCLFTNILYLFVLLAFWWRLAHHHHLLNPFTPNAPQYILVRPRISSEDDDHRGRENILFHCFRVYILACSGGSGLLCYCQGSCPDGRKNGTCEAALDAGCFASAEEVGFSLVPWSAYSPNQVLYLNIKPLGLWLGHGHSGCRANVRVSSSGRSWPYDVSWRWVYCNTIIDIIAILFIVLMVMIPRSEPPRHSDSDWVLSEGRSLQPEALPHVRPGKVRSHCWLW